MYKFFTANDTKRWIDVLQDLVKNYNTSRHRMIKMTPKEALEHPYNVENKSVATSNISKFKPGDFVRISKYRKTFKRGYTANYTDEVFIISDVLKTIPVTYTIVDIKAQKIIGTFYEEELSLFKPVNVSQII